MIYLFNKYCIIVANIKNTVHAENKNFNGKSCERSATTMKFNGILKKFIIVDRAVSGT